MEDLWLAWAKRLQSIAATGLHFGRSEYDKERYEEIATIANQMLSRLGKVPISRIEGLVPDFAQGYATPKVEVRGAVIEQGKILLVQEKSDRLWTLPGGYADVGISPAENVVKEIREEAGLRVEARALYGLRHKAKHGYDADARDFYKLFFLCEPTQPGRPEPGLETTAAAFFAPDALPPLSTGRVLETDIAAAFAFRGDPSKPAAFD